MGSYPTRDVIFAEWLDNLQGKIEIPSDVYDFVHSKVTCDLSSDRPLALAQTQSLVRNVLHKYRMNKHYEHHKIIARRLLDLDTPRFTPEVEGQLREMYGRVHPVLSRHSVALSLVYIVRKMLQLIGEPEHEDLDDINPAKIIRQDEQWQLVCHDLGWTFSPTNV